MGWQVRESAPHSYEVGVDDRTRSEGTRSGYIRSRPHASGFGTLMQTIKADVYLGQRLRLTGRVKTNRVEGWVGLWMRVDAPNGDVLGFDNMNDRRIQGTTGWTAYDVVLDVPSSATSIAFGVLLDGPGQTWLDDVVLTVVTDAVPTTALPADIDDPPARAVNLDFEA
jgi:hypothetical protein